MLNNVKPLAPLTLLLADDDLDECFFFENALETLPWKTYLNTVNDGVELMDYLHEHVEILPDVIFLDLNMPRKNGIECLLEIRQHQKFKQLPVVIYSTLMDDVTVDMLYKNGANFYLHKCDIGDLPKYIELALYYVTENKGRLSRDQFVIKAHKLQRVHIR